MGPAGMTALEGLPGIYESGGRTFSVAEIAIGLPGQIRRVKYARYTKQDGSPAVIPLANSGEQSAVSWEGKDGDGNTVDLYLSKGFRYRTVADERAWAKKSAEGAEVTRLMLAARDPVERERMRAKLHAEAMVEAQRSSGGWKPEARK